MVIEEVTAIQEDLEVERSCRESAEALAVKVHFIFRQILSTILLKDNEPAVCHTICVISMILTLPTLSKPGFKLDLNPIKHAHNQENHIIKLIQESM